MVNGQIMVEQQFRSIGIEQQFRSIGIEQQFEWILDLTIQIKLRDQSGSELFLLILQEQLLGQIRLKEIGCVTGKRVHGVNDNAENQTRLAQLSKGFRWKVFVQSTT